MAKELTLKETLAKKQRLLEMGVTGDQVTVTENVATLLGKDAQGINDGEVAHRSDPVQIMYDAEGRQRQIPEGSVRVALGQGLTLYCPHCDGLHETDDPNACPAKKPLRYRVCPVQGCGKRIFDDPANEGSVTVAETDENAIATELPSTPEARTQAKLEAHMLAYHEVQARMMGIRAPIEPARAGTGR